MTVIEQIKAEIERLKVDYLNRSYTFVPTAMQQLLDFIDTLESEKPMNQEGLDEEIKRYIDEYYKEDCIVLIAHVARHFAKWGAEHTPLPEDTVLFNKGVEEGKRLMMKEAVEGTYNNSDWGTPCIDLQSPLELERFDKVKIIIVNEEENGKSD